jgi:hypothetical protein
MLKGIAVRGAVEFESWLTDEERDGADGEGASGDDGAGISDGKRHETMG